MAAVAARNRRDESRLPSRHKAVVGIERRQTREPGRDDPQLAVRERHLVHQRVAGVMAVARQITRVVRARRLELRGDRGHVPVVPHLGSRGQRKPAGGDRHPHWLVEVPEVGVEEAALFARADQLAALVRRHEQRAAAARQQPRERHRRDAAERRGPGPRGGGPPGRRCRRSDQLGPAVGGRRGPMQVGGELRRGRRCGAGRQHSGGRLHRRQQRLVVRDVQKAAQPLQLGARLGEQRREIARGPALRRQRLEVVEQQLGDRGPLRDDDLLEWQPRQVTPARRQRQRPGGAVPIGQRGAARKAARAPGGQHLGDRRGRLAKADDEARVREHGREQRHAQRQPRAAGERAHIAGCVRGAPLAIDQRLEQPVADRLRQRRRLIGAHGVAAPIAPGGVDLRQRLEKGGVGRPRSPHPARARERVVEHGRARERGGDGEDG